ncbi:ETC complex I subunit conserved region-domain-containing protein [Xylariomycetidae sp. FL2044]|nr:ETC complex I subunit conserved region-domain-containing protein [Xylariomycetidae sp. FL2044]
MRRTLRLFASVKPARYLEAGNPTGLTGLYTHSSPRSSLLYLYSRTLEKLGRFPESSAYRQSVEALTKHRMAIVEAAEPAGHREWSERALKILQEHGGEFGIQTEAGPGGARLMQVASGGQVFVHRTDPEETDERTEEWDGEPVPAEDDQGLRGPDERQNILEMYDEPYGLPNKVKWEAEPQLTADQIEEIENKIGAGLIEEVVQVAESELRLVDIMYGAKVWESLEEKPAEGQWTYFER